MLELSIPAVPGMVVVGLYNMMDSIFAGQMTGAAQIRSDMGTRASTEHYKIVIWLKGDCNISVLYCQINLLKGAGNQYVAVGVSCFFNFALYICGHYGI